MKLKVNDILYALDNHFMKDNHHQVLTKNKKYLIIDLSHDDEDGDTIIIIDDESDKHRFSFKNLSKFFYWDVKEIRIKKLQKLNVVTK